MTRWVRQRAASRGQIDHFVIAITMGQGIEPFQFMLNANNLPTTEFADYTFVFR
jgi:hypothetical protein